MNHLFFFLALIALTVGIAALAIVGLLSIKYRKKLLIYYFLLLATVSLLFFTQIVDLFYNILRNDFNGEMLPINHFTMIAYYLLYAIIVYLLPFLVNMLIGKEFNKKKRALFIGLALIFPAGIISYYITGLSFLEPAADFLLFSAIIYGIVLLNLNLDKIVLEDLRKFSRALLFLFLFFTPLFIFENFLLLSLNEPYNWIYDPSHVLIFFYISWNVLNIVYAARSFFKPLIHDYLHIPVPFIQKFGITEREVQIIQLVLYGDSNKEISYKLSISEKTAKNHIYNIFQKTGARNRTELLKTLKLC